MADVEQVIFGILGVLIIVGALTKIFPTMDMTMAFILAAGIVILLMGWFSERTSKSKRH